MLKNKTIISAFTAILLNAAIGNACLINHFRGENLDCSNEYRQIENSHSAVFHKKENQYVRSFCGSRHNKIDIVYQVDKTGFPEKVTIKEYGELSTLKMLSYPDDAYEFESGSAVYVYKFMDYKLSLCRTRPESFSYGASLSPITQEVL